MANQQIVNQREGAEICNGEFACKQKVEELLTKFNLPKGIIPLKEMVELGYNPQTGFLWIKQKKKIDYKFLAIGKNASYDSEITGFFEGNRLKKITGVKVKEMMIWVGISDIRIDEKEPEKLTFMSASGISKTFPASDFVLEHKK